MADGAYQEGEGSRPLQGYQQMYLLFSDTAKWSLNHMAASLTQSECTLISATLSPKYVILKYYPAGTVLSGEELRGRWP